ncbi:MAG: glycosyltransferase family 4 protein [Candidatus Omnitrophota bacterium]
MKILFMHNRYVIPGGEDSVFDAELRMLRQGGDEVIACERSNQELERASFSGKLAFLFKESVWNSGSYQRVAGLISAHHPDIAHIHNPFYLLSPSVYQACFDAGIPVVQTLHNYRFLCAAATFYRDGRVCEECLGHGRLRAMRYACWRRSPAATAGMLRVVDAYYRRSVLKKISRFIALSEFSSSKFLAAGFPAEKVVVKPNFLDIDPGFQPDKGGFGLYVGGFYDYKGVRTLAKALAGLSGPVAFKMIGDGPLLAECRQLVGRAPVEFLGRKGLDEVLAQIKDASFVVLPSECYENFPRVIVEAMACGTPVMASAHGAMRELIDDGRTGMLFRAFDVEALREKIGWAQATPDALRAMGRNARREYENKYTRAINSARLRAIYAGCF